MGSLSLSLDSRPAWYARSSPKLGEINAIQFLSSSSSTSKSRVSSRWLTFHAAEKKAKVKLFLRWCNFSSLKLDFVDDNSPRREWLFLSTKYSNREKLCFISFLKVGIDIDVWLLFMRVSERRKKAASRREREKFEFFFDIIRCLETWSAFETTKLNELHMIWWARLRQRNSMLLLVFTFHFSTGNAIIVVCLNELCASWMIYNNVENGCLTSTFPEFETFTILFSPFFYSFLQPHRPMVKHWCMRNFSLIPNERSHM